MNKGLTIYFHKDFDGTVSAAFFTAIMKLLGSYDQFSYKPVDFDLKDVWLDMNLQQPAAVLDFFYHPDAIYYYDHHASPIAERFFGKEMLDVENMCLDLSFKSTPAILKYKFQDCFDFGEYQDLLDWSDIIDNSEYSSPKVLYESKDTYIELNKLISYHQHHNNDEEIVKLIPFILSGVDDYLEEKRGLIDHILQKELQVIEELQRNMIIDQGISFVDQSRTGFTVQRFVSYYYYPELDYQIIIYAKKAEYMVNFGRNAWKEFPSKNLGEIATKYGGFGRKDVGGILVKTHIEAEAIAKVIMDELLKCEGA